MLRSPAWPEASFGISARVLGSGTARPSAGAANVPRTSRRSGGPPAQHRVDISSPRDVAHRPGRAAGADGLLAEAGGVAPAASGDATAGTQDGGHGAEDRASRAPRHCRRLCGQRVARAVGRLPCLPEQHAAGQGGGPQSSSGRMWVGKNCGWEQARAKMAMPFCAMSVWERV